MEQLQFFMELADFCRAIESGDEFTFDRRSVEGLELVKLSTKEEEAKLLQTLTLMYWKLPKDRVQAEWRDWVVEKLSARADHQSVLLHFLEHLKGMWDTIGLRRKTKFVLLLERVIEQVARRYPTPFETFIQKGPCAEYDLPIMKQVVLSRQSLTDEEVEYLVSYLLAHADTYFRNFFLKTVLPLLQERQISLGLAERAYAAANKENVSNPMREVLYELYGCADRS